MLAPQALYSLISPGWFHTPVYGNDYYLFHSAYFWLCVPFAVIVALAPRYLTLAWKFGFRPNDIDILRYIRKMEPERDIAADAQPASVLATGLHLRRAPSSISRATSRSSVGSMPPPQGRPSADLRSGSRTDMATGLRSVHRGFDFATEENGVAMRRMQSNLSEVRQSTLNLALNEHGSAHERRGRLRSLGHVFSRKRLRKE
jgi:phospholipid-translocating ATPase